MQPAAPNHSPNATPPRILIADDDPLGAELLEAYLSGHDYELRTASDGEQTLQFVAAWHPDLILLDVMMPRISGFEVCKRLRRPRHARHRHPDGHGPRSAQRRGPRRRCRHPRFRVQADQQDRASPAHPRLLRSRQYKRELDRALAYIEEVERERTTMTAHASSCNRAVPVRFMAGIRGSTPGPSPPSRESRSTATWSNCSRTPAISWLADCTTAAARSVFASTPGTWGPPSIGTSSGPGLKMQYICVVCSDSMVKDVLAGSSSARATGCPAAWSIVTTAGWPCNSRVWDWLGGAICSSSCWSNCSGPPVFTAHRARHRPAGRTRSARRTRLG